MSRDSSGVRTTRLPVIWVGVIVHAALVFVLFFALVASSGRNIGNGLATMPLAALGFPWSVLFPQASGPAGASLDVVLLLAALVNVGIHAAIIGFLTRRTEDD